MTEPRKLLIVGLGLLGASLGMALRGGPYLRLGWTRRKTVRDWSVAQNAVDRTSDSLESLLAEADLTVLALPIPQILEFMETYRSAFRPGSVLTDLGSVKSEMLKPGSKLAERNVAYVGSHPMAGTEKSGPEAAFPSLYSQASVFVCPNDFAPEPAVRQVEELWKTLGTKVSRIDAHQHDELVAHTSHVLHIIASALTLGILDSGSPEQTRRRFDGCATGFKDTSRIASSSPRMWREIIEYNQPAVLTALDDFEKSFRHLRAMIETRDFDGFETAFARGKELRDKWLRYKGMEK